MILFSLVVLQSHTTHNQCSTILLISLYLYITLSLCLSVCLAVCLYLALFILFPLNLHRLLI